MCCVLLPNLHSPGVQNGAVKHGQTKVELQSRGSFQAACFVHKSFTGLEEVTHLMMDLPRFQAAG